MTILSRSAGIDRIHVGILFPFTGFPQIQGSGGPHDPAGAGVMPSVAWDLGPGAGVAAGIIGLVPGTMPQPRQEGMARNGAEEEAAAFSGPSRVLPGAEAPGTGRFKQGFAADPLHCLPAHDPPHAQARQDLRAAADGDWPDGDWPDRDWPDGAAQADSFVFLPVEAPGRAGDADHPALPPAAGDWSDLLILRPAADPAIDFVPEVPVLADPGPLMTDHVFF